MVFKRSYAFFLKRLASQFVLLGLLRRSQRFCLRIIAERLADFAHGFPDGRSDSLSSPFTTDLLPAGFEALRPIFVAVAAAYGDFGLRPIRSGSRRRFLFFPWDVKPVLHELGVLRLRRTQAPEADLVLFEAPFLGSLFLGLTKDCRSNQSFLKIWSMI